MRNYLKAEAYYVIKVPDFWIICLLFINKATAYVIRVHRGFVISMEGHYRQHGRFHTTLAG